MPDNIAPVCPVCKESRCRYVLRGDSKYKRPGWPFALLLMFGFMLICIFPVGTVLGISLYIWLFTGRKGYYVCQSEDCRARFPADE